MFPFPLARARCAALVPGTTRALACCAVRLARRGLGQRFIGEAPMNTAEAAVLPETLQASRFPASKPPPGDRSLPLFFRLGAEAAVNFGELAAVFDAVIGQGERLFFPAGLQI